MSERAVPHARKAQPDLPDLYLGSGGGGGGETDSGGRLNKLSNLFLPTDAVPRFETLYCFVLREAVRSPASGWDGLPLLSWGYRFDDIGCSGGRSDLGNAWLGVIRFQRAVTQIFY